MQATGDPLEATPASLPRTARSVARICRGPASLARRWGRHPSLVELSFPFPLEVAMFRVLFPHRKEEGFKARGTVKFLREAEEDRPVARSHVAGAGTWVTPHPTPPSPEVSGTQELGLVGPLLCLPVVNDIPMRNAWSLQTLSDLIPTADAPLPHPL